MFILTRSVENDEEDAILDGESTYLERIECSFQEGIFLPSEDIQVPILFKFNEFTLRGKMTDHLCIDKIPGPIFSLKAKALFEKLRISNIEYYQLNLLDEYQETKSKIQKQDDKEKEVIEYTDYFIANVVGLVDCVDHEKSVLEYFYPPELRNQESERLGQGNDDIIDPFADENPNDIDFITKLVLDETKIDPDLKIFRLKDKPDLLVFHESVVHLIRKANLSGFVFVPVSEYTDVIPDDELEEPQQEEPKEIEKKRIFFG